MYKENISEREIKDLENKKQELTKLLAEKNKSSATNAKPSDRTALYLSLGMVGIVLVGLVMIFVRKNKKRKY